MESKIACDYIVEKTTNYECYVTAIMQRNHLLKCKAYYS